MEGLDGKVRAALTYFLQLDIKWGFVMPEAANLKGKAKHEGVSSTDLAVRRAEALLHVQHGFQERLAGPSQFPFIWVPPRLM